MIQVASVNRLVEHDGERHRQKPSHLAPLFTGIATPWAGSPLEQCTGSRARKMRNLCSPCGEAASTGAVSRPAGDPSVRSRTARPSEAPCREDHRGPFWNRHPCGHDQRHPGHRRRRTPEFAPSHRCARPSQGWPGQRPAMMLDSWADASRAVALPTVPVLACGVPSGRYCHGAADPKRRLGWHPAAW